MWLIFTIVFILFTCYIGLFLMYKIGWNKMKAFSSNVELKAQTKFSIIIPARNEARNIKVLLDSILENDYPTSQYEIIVIDDFSEDETAAIVKSYSQENVNLISLADHIHEGERINAFKKKALEVAIQQVKYDWIITTDADCLVLKDWLKTLDAFIQTHSQTQLIAAPVSFIPYDKSNALYYFQSLDFMTMQGITAASVYYDLGSMANGANFAFSIQAYHAVDGYKGIDHIASGDDMLLMQKIRKQFPESIAYLKAQSVIVHTQVQKDYASFLNQRIRWASKSGAYQEWKLKGSLLIVYLFNLSLLGLFIAGVWHWQYWIALLILIVGKTIIELIFIKDLATFFNKAKELKYFPWLQPLHILYVILAGFLGMFGSYDWKGRKVK